MPLDQFLLDHYMLDTLDMQCKRALQGDPFRRSLQRLDEDLQQVAQSWEPLALELMRDFVALCCVDELRYTSHLRSWNQESLKPITLNPLKYAREALVREALKIFESPHWEPGYGGPKWVTIAQRFLNRDLPTRADLNALITACHNGGTVFNRCFDAAPALGHPQWAYTDGFDVKGALKFLTDRGPLHLSEAGSQQFKRLYPISVALYLCLERAAVLGLIDVCVNDYAPVEYVYPQPLTWGDKVFEAEMYLGDPREIDDEEEEEEED